MKKHPSSSLSRALLFAAIALTVYGLALLVVRVVPLVEKPDLLSAALTLDLVVLVPAVYYLLLVRSRRAPPISLLPVILLSFAAASAVLPDRHQKLLQILSGALPLAELGLFGWVGHRIWRLTREGQAVDFYDRMRQQLKGLLGVPLLAEVLAYELSLLYYALRLPRAIVRTADQFSHHRKSGYGMVLGVLFMVAGGELFGAHLLLERWSHTAALLHLLLSLYGIVWLLGDFRALRARPHRMTETCLEVRTGLRWNMDVPWSQVASIRRAWGPRPEERAGYRALVPLASIDYLITLKEEGVAFGPYGLRKPFRRIGIQIDEKERFEQRLGQLGLEVNG